MGPSKRPRLAASRQPVHARTTPGSHISKRVGTRGASSPRVFLRHSSTGGSRRLRTSSLPASCSSTRRARPLQAEHPPSKPKTNLLPEVPLPVTSGTRHLRSYPRRSSFSTEPRETKEPSHAGGQVAPSKSSIPSFRKYDFASARAPVETTRGNCSKRGVNWSRSAQIPDVGRGVTITVHAASYPSYRSVPITNLLARVRPSFVGAGFVSVLSSAGARSLITAIRP